MTRDPTPYEQAPGVYAGALVNPWHQLVAREAAAIWPAMPSPRPPASDTFIDPCANGHGTLVVRAGWLYCSRCNQQIARA